jgi:hypothetical protein
MKAKEWLYANKHISKIGRGRISHANHVLLNNAYADGQRFSDWTPDKVALSVTETTDKATGETVETVTAHRIDGYDASGNIAEIAPYRYNHNTHKAVEADGTVRSLREVCFNDGVSLVQCTCGTPRVVARNGQGYVPVTIVAGASKPRKGNIWDK